MSRQYTAEGFVKIPFNITVTGRDDEEVWDNIVNEIERLYDVNASEYTIDFISEK